MDTFREMTDVGVKPNILTYTTLVKGWASASFPEKAVLCFEQMKAGGIVPDYAVYHCLLNSLLSRASVARDSVVSSITSVCEEMAAQGFCVDMETALTWEKYLKRAEHYPGELTRAVEMVFPPDWTEKGKKPETSV
jgi:pentatricopeptide repeat protein